MPRLLATASLLQANEDFLYYRKGGLAMYALSQYIGKEKVNGALRSLLQKHHSEELSLPTTLDLYQELEELTPDFLKLPVNRSVLRKYISAPKPRGGPWRKRKQGR